MKIRIESIIPSGDQYENIHVSYEEYILEGDHKDYDKAINECRDKLTALAQEDIRKLHEYKKVSKDGFECVISGVVWRRFNDKWEYYEGGVWK